jgi:NRPS condensation-like uncharacterized protein
MRRKVESSLNSIPLNCAEKCLLALDSIHEPMLFHITLSVEGDIEHTKLNQAIVLAQRAHPVMRTIVRSRNLRLFREIQEDLGRGVLSIADQAQRQETNYESYLSSWMNKPLHIKKESPLRVLLLRKNRRESSLVFTFHHSAADGLRALLFVRQVIGSYNNEFSKNYEAEGDIRVNRNEDELLEFAHSQRSKVQHYYGKMICGLLRRFVIAALPPPARVFHDKSGKSRELHFCFKVVNAEELEQIQSKARAAKVALNDIFLAACCRVVEKWNNIHGKASRKIRIMAPVNIGPKGFGYVVSNQVSWLSLTTTPRNRADPAKLLRKVRADTTNAIRNGIAFSLVYFLYFCSRFPLFIVKGMCRFFIITRTYVDTMLVTNLGSIWSRTDSEEMAVSSMGYARILDVAVSAPVVTPMGLSIAAVTYNENLKFCLSYRPSFFSEGEAQLFLDLYIEEIKQHGSERST